MDQRLRQWKLAIERFWQDPAPDYREIARLVAEMAVSDEITLRQAATQAMPSLRNAVAKKPDRAMREIAGLNRVLVVNFDQPAAGPEPDGTRIVAAVSSHDPYIVTADGSRYYVGARLPRGGRLAGIEDGTVLVDHDGRVEHLKLPGASFGS